MRQSLSISIGVQGRLHAFDLAKALAERDDVDVALYTNYSTRECEVFQFPKNCNLRHRVSHRWIQAILYRALGSPLPTWAERWLHESFGRWLAKGLEAKPSRVARIFSGVALESLRSKVLENTLRIVTRGSSHIQTQYSILEEEGHRAGVLVDRPSEYMIQRELLEYDAADSVLVLSSFARDSFLHQGYDSRRVWCVPNAVDAQWYAATPEMIEVRRLRILSGQKLRVLMVGAFSLRKGILDFEAVVGVMAADCEFRFVGDMPSEGSAVRARLDGKVDFRPRVHPRELRGEYGWGDLFVFPTLEDGYPAALSQALAAGLPTLTTPNCSGPDLIRTGHNGWIVPIRDPQAIIERLRWALKHRDELAEIALNAASGAANRSWAVVGEEFVSGARLRLQGMRFA
jgi:glycosyltransferase involved in cell wall biosynthesis